jgi:hypothetical protein
MKFAEAAEQLRLAQIEGRRQEFHSSGHWCIGFSGDNFWWSYYCCDACEVGDYESYETVEQLISAHGDRCKDWGFDWT